MILDPLRACRVATWGAAVMVGDQVVDALDARVELPTASIGKVFLLLAVAEGVEQGTLDPAEELEIADRDLVADSGILQFLDRRRRSVGDLATLVGAVSDNLATNLLLRRVGLASVADIAGRVGITVGGLHDSVRDTRVAGVHPPYLSTGCAAELVAVMRGLTAGHLVSACVSAQVRRWLAVNTDLSMVASAFALDPLAHTRSDLGLRLVNKTGTNVGTRADIGAVTSTGGAGERTTCYVVIARWPDDDFARRESVLTAMRSVGQRIRVDSQHSW